MSKKVNLAISGCPRSGTSPLHVFLSKDPRILLTHEMSTFMPGGPYFDGRHPKMSNFHVHAHKFSFEHKNLDMEEFVKQSKKRGLRGLEFLDFMREFAPGVSVAGDKECDVYIQTMEHILSLPDTKMIIIYRDGRDSIASYRRYYDDGHRPHWAKSTVKEAEPIWLLPMKKVMFYKTRDVDNLMLVRYEELTADPISYMPKIQEFLGLEPLIFEGIDFYKPVRVGTWKEEYPDMMDELSDEFKNFLIGLGYEV
jgi:hypothetical protein